MRRCDLPHAPSDERRRGGIHPVDLQRRLRQRLGDGDVLVAGSAARFDDRAEHVPRLHIHVHQFGGDESVNGLVQISVSAMRAAGPAVARSLFSLSLSIGK